MVDTMTSDVTATGDAALAKDCSGSFVTTDAVAAWVGASEAVAAVVGEDCTGIEEEEKDRRAGYDALVIGARVKKLARPVRLRLIWLDDSDAILKRWMMGLEI